MCYEFLCVTLRDKCFFFFKVFYHYAYNKISAHVFEKEKKNEVRIIMPILVLSTLL